MEVKLLKVIFGDNVSSKEKEQKFYWDFISDSGTLILPDGITEIPDCAFKNSKDLRKITIPEGVTSIGTDAFVGCTNLTEIVLPESISSIGIDAFGDCKNLQKINIPENLQYFSGDQLIWSRKLPLLCRGNKLICYYSAAGEISLPQGITVIGSYAFYKCSDLTKIILPENLGTISFRAFTHCSKLTEINFPEKLTAIGASAFERCS